ncbi:cell division protein SepF [Candidatus Bathyarchaeota archaeon]|nr:cell division protein SepF [Candidatus Bathyarchaeota archaeon]
MKAMPLRRLADVETIKREIEAGNILILKVSPLAKKSVADVKQAVSDLYEFAKSIDADIARLGEERVVITPPPIRIWRQKKSSEEEDLPTAA